MFRDKKTKASRTDATNVEGRQTFNELGSIATAFAFSATLRTGMLPAYYIISGNRYHTSGSWFLHLTSFVDYLYNQLQNLRLHHLHPRHLEVNLTSCDESVIFINGWSLPSQLTEDMLYTTLTHFNVPHRAYHGNNSARNSYLPTIFTLKMRQTQAGATLFGCRQKLSLFSKVDESGNQVLLLPWLLSLMASNKWVIHRSPYMVITH